MVWTFREIPRAEVKSDPSEGQFFTPGGIADGLVRESIQNSLDAQRNGECVRVRFHFSSDRSALSPRAASRYLSGLWPHLNVIEGGRPNLPEPNDPLTFLVIEDFGTRGLRGSTEQSHDADVQSDSRQKHNDFYYFWRNVGRSGKGDTQRGSWGLGKTVFPAASRLNSFFGYTIRSDDRESYLMGQSVLKIHSIADTQFCPYGFFANTEDDGFQLPLSDVEILSDFCSDFQLRRTNEPGLSIVIPFPDDEEINSQRMIQSAIIHYFYPIIRRELVVEVSGDNRDLLIDGDSIDHVTDLVNWNDTPFTGEQLHKLFSFVRRCIEVPDIDLLRLPEPKPPGAPVWYSGRFDAETVAAIKQRFAEKEMLVIRVPVTVRPKKGNDRQSHFDVFLERDQSLQSAEDHYIRQGITISHIATLREKGFRGLVVVADEPLRKLLVDAENPAHTEWLEKATKLKEHYEWGPFTVRFVRNALPRIVAQLLFVPEGRDEQLLKDIFFLEENSDEGRDKAKRKRKKQPETDDDSPDDPVPPLPPLRKQPFVIQKIAGGFRVTCQDGEETPPNEIPMKVAYAVRRGDAFKRYEKWDFDLGKRPIGVTPVGAEYVAEGNILTIMPKANEFLVEVVGFDPHRDLAIRTLRKKEVADAAEV